MSDPLDEYPTYLRVVVHVPGGDTYPAVIVGRSRNGRHLAVRADDHGTEHMADPEDLTTDGERHCRRLSTHGPHEYQLPRTTRALHCPGVAHDHDARCCREHGTHTSPHKGCILR